jgi:hypothetical protein
MVLKTKVEKRKRLDFGKGGWVLSKFRYSRSTVTVVDLLVGAGQEAQKATLAISCLSGCFSRPLSVVWTSASTAVPEDLAGISGEVCQ